MPWLSFSHVRQALESEGPCVRTNSAHSSSERPVFAGNSSVHFLIMATPGWTSNLILGMMGEYTEITRRDRPAAMIRALPLLLCSLAIGFAADAPKLPPASTATI